jgi:hypothetical protein
MIFSGRFILNLSGAFGWLGLARVNQSTNIPRAEHVRDGISGEQSSSRTPVTPGAHHPGFRAGNQLASGNEQDGGLVVKVVQNVITMRDLGRDSDAETKSGGHGPWDDGRMGP